MNKIWIVWTRSYCSDCNCGEIDSVFQTEELAKAREKELYNSACHCWIDEYEVKNEI